MTIFTYMCVLVCVRERERMSTGGAEDALDIFYGARVFRDDPDTLCITNDTPIRVLGSELCTYRGSRMAFKIRKPTLEQLPGISRMCVVTISDGEHGNETRYFPFAGGSKLSLYIPMCLPELAFVNSIAYPALDEVPLNLCPDEYIEMDIVRDEDSRNFFVKMQQVASGLKKWFRLGNCGGDDSPSLERFRFNFWIDFDPIVPTRAGRRLWARAPTIQFRALRPTDAPPDTHTHTGGGCKDADTGGGWTATDTIRELVKMRDLVRAGRAAAVDPLSLPGWTASRAPFWFLVALAAHVRDRAPIVDAERQRPTQDTAFRAHLLREPVASFPDIFGSPAAEEYAMLRGRSSVERVAAAEWYRG
jgi:hypothetical protein